MRSSVFQQYYSKFTLKRTVYNKYTVNLDYSLIRSNAFLQTVYHSFLELESLKR